MDMVHKNHNQIFTKVGIDAHGLDWKIFFDKLTAISSTNIVELDYSGFEYNHLQTCFAIAADFVYLLLRRSGCTEEHASAAALLIKSCCGGYVLDNEVLTFVWMLLSGLPITAELNSLLNQIYQALCFRHLTNLPLSNYTSLVCSGYYGDDLLHAVHDSIAPLFNSITIQKFCADHLGMKVTPASNKSGDMVPFVSILDCSFLKRRFAPREDRVDAPLNLDAMTDSLQYYVPVSHMTQRELLASKARSFITELTHYPQEIFDYWLEILRSLRSQYVLDFIPYEYAAALHRRLQNQV